jgi:spore coat protein U-like protein
MNKNSVSLLALALAAAFAGSATAAEDTSTLSVSAELTTACEVSAASSIDFGSFAALLSTGDKTANSGSTFQVACSNSATPTIYVSGTREMANGANVLPFNLSLTAGAAADDLSADSGAADALTVTQDGALHDVVIYGKVAAADFQALPSGSYTTDVTVHVVY